MTPASEAERLNTPAARLRRRVALKLRYHPGGLRRAWLHAQLLAEGFTPGAIRRATRGYGCGPVVYPRGRRRTTR